MEDVKLRHFEGLLHKERERLLERLDTMNKADLRQSFKEFTGELSSYDNHPADEGSLVFEREKDLGLAEGAREAVRRIDEALDRIKSGTYGTCEVCGRPIDEERLETIPYADRCKDCQEEEDAIEDRFPRPIEEKVIGPPFGDHFADETSPGVDGEDVWQTLAGFGSSDGPADAPWEGEYGEAVMDMEGPPARIDEVEPRLEDKAKVESEQEAAEQERVKARIKEIEKGPRPKRRRSR